MLKIVTSNDSVYPIKPVDIDVEKHFFNAFGNYEREISARWIVRMCQEKEGWVPFTGDDINTFYHASGRRPLSEDFLFNGLDNGEYLVLEGDEYCITHEFITACFKSSPRYQPSIVTN